MVSGPFSVRRDSASASTALHTQRPPEAPAEHFSAGATRLLGKGIETGEVVFIDPKGHDSGFAFSGSDEIASETKARHGLTSRTASQPFRCRQVPMQSADTRVPQTRQGPRLATRSLGFPVTPTTRSWNSVVVFLRDWNALRVTA
jgi:hypothetical protein